MEGKIKIGVVGAFQNGKSTFINCLLDGVYARIGDGRRTTVQNTYYRYGETDWVYYLDAKRKVIKESDLPTFLSNDWTKDTNIRYVEVTAWKPVLQHLTFVDTPGIDANEKDNDCVAFALKELDAAVFVLRNKDISQPEMKLMTDLGNHGIPFFVVINCHPTGANILSWAPTSKQNQTILENGLKPKISQLDIKPQSIAGNSILPVNLMWYWYATGKWQQEDEASKETLLENISYYQKKKKRAISSLEWAKESGFLVLRSLFCQAPTNYLPAHLKLCRELNNNLLAISELFKQYK